jgi:hypothetical protein
VVSKILIDLLAGDLKKSSTSLIAGADLAVGREGLKPPTVVTTMEPLLNFEGMKEKEDGL